MSENRFQKLVADRGPWIHLVLVTPEIPANTGNVVRLCAATQVPLHLVEPLGFDLNDRILKRAGLDYWSLCEIHKHLTFEELEQNYPMARFLFLTKRAERSFFDLDIQSNDFLVLGSESRGLSDQFLAQGNRSSRTFRIPMLGKTRSLNLSTAAGIVVYESLRQLGLLNQKPTELPCRPSL